MGNCKCPTGIYMCHPSLFSRVCAVGKRFEGKTEHTEKWYGTQYHYRKIAPETISQWESVSDTEQLHLPAVNEFIPTDFELVPIPDGAPKVPVLVQVRSKKDSVD